MNDQSETIDYGPGSDDVEWNESRTLRELQDLISGTCTDCGHQYPTRDAVCSIVLGFKDAPRCLACIARGLGRNIDELREDLVAHIKRRDCFLKAWREAERHDKIVTGSDLWPVPKQATVATQPEPTTANVWDAGDIGCGELVMALRQRMNKLAAGAVLEVHATDPAAPEDIPAWCRMSGHRLVAMCHPTYSIQRKGD